MLAATTRSTAARLVIGIIDARGMRSTRIIASVIQWTTPAIGVRPPFLTLAAVLAIAPVAGMPPKSPEKILPRPWPTSSALDLCVSPIIPSDTTAESSDSIPARIAIVKAGEISLLTISKVTFGSFGVGNEEFSSPNTLPIVLTSRPVIFTRRVVIIIATREPGILSVIFGHTSIMITASSPTRAALGLINDTFLTRAATFGRKSDGTFSRE